MALLVLAVTSGSSRLEAAGIAYTKLATLGSIGSSIRSAPLLKGSELFVACYSGGSNSAGSVFAYNVSTENITHVYSFSGLFGVNGSSPQGGLALLGDVFYGTTVFGGTNTTEGVLFKLTPSGVYTKLLDFGGAIGGEPTETLAVSGDTLYGSTLTGGTYNWGSLFAATTNGAIVWTKMFDGTNGRHATQLIPLGDYLYGATFGGGVHSDGTTFRIKKDGTGFTTLYSFAGGSDGAYPYSLSLGWDGRMYGTTAGYAGDDDATVFYMGTNGIPTTVLHLTDGDYATGATLGPNGLIYATTRGTGKNGNAGRVYQLGTNGSALTLVTYPYPSQVVTQAYVAPITFGPDNRAYYGYYYSNSFVRLGFPMATALKIDTLTCTNTAYSWSAVAGQAYAVRQGDDVSTYSTIATVVPTNGVGQYVGRSFRTNTFTRLVVFTTNTMTGFDVAMTNGAVMRSSAWGPPVDQRDTNCVPRYVGGGSGDTNGPPSP